MSTPAQSTDQGPRDGAASRDADMVASHELLTAHLDGLLDKVEPVLVRNDLRLAVRSLMSTVTQYRVLVKSMVEDIEREHEVDKLRYERRQMRRAEVDKLAALGVSTLGKRSRDDSHVVRLDRPDRGQRAAALDSSL
ncbi:hypothetical protein JCM8208_006650 [Rhodotorula glutinis]